MEEEIKMDKEVEKRIGGKKIKREGVKGNM